MVSIGDHDHGAVPVLTAPLQQELTFGVSSVDGARDLLNRRHAKRPELASESGRLVFVGNSATSELVVRGIGRLREDSYCRGNAGVNEVGRFEHAGVAGIDRHDDDIGTFDRVIDDECPSSRLQDRSSKSGYRDTGRNRQQEDCC